MGREVGAAWVSVLPEVDGFGKDLDRKIGPQVDQSGKEHGKRFGLAFAALAGGAIGIALTKVSGFAKGSVDAFAAVEDATGAAGVQFGKALPQVLAFADKASTSFGLSKRAALDAQNTFGTLGKAAGLQGAPLAGFSQKLTGLAGDLASFKGTSTEQAIQAVGAALRGESEPIRAYGVLLDDATLRQQALAMGLIKTTKDALTPQQKALAAQAAILKQTTDAQGDYQRTSSSTANVQKTLAAETENAQAALGAKLAPAITAVRQLLLGLIEGLTGLVDTVGPALGHVKDGVMAFIQSLQDGDVTSGGFVGAMERIGSFLHTELLPRLEQLRAFVHDQVLPALGMAGQFVLTQVVPALRGLATFVTGSLIPSVANLLRAVSPLLLDGLKLVVAAGFVVFKVALEALGPALTAVGAVLKSVTGFLAEHKVVLGTLAVVVGTFSAVLGAQALALGAVRAATTLWGATTALVTGILNTARAAVLIFNLALAANPVGLVVAALVALGAGLVLAYKNSETFRAVVNKLWDWLRKFIGFTPLGALIENFDKVRNAVGYVVDKVEALIHALGRIHVPKINLPNIPGFATGVRNFGGGLAIVGEQGPELAYLGRGTSILPAPQTAEVLGMSGERGVTYQANVYPQQAIIDEREVGAVLSRLVLLHGVAS